MLKHVVMNALISRHAKAKQISRPGFNISRVNHFEKQCAGTAGSLCTLYSKKLSNFGFCPLHPDLGRSYVVHCKYCTSLIPVSHFWPLPLRGKPLFNML